MFLLQQKIQIKNSQHFGNCIRVDNDSPLTNCRQESNPVATAPEPYHASFVGVCVAAGVVGPRPVALRVEEPAAAVSADLHHHFCPSKRN